MRYINNIFLAGLMILLVFPSCKKFLTKSPKYLLVPEVAVYDEKSAEAILNGAYSFVGKDEWTVRFTGGFSSMVGAVNYNTAAANFNMAATGDNENLWQIFYKTINGANAAIIAIENLADDVFVTPGRKQEMIAEAKGLRAFAHLYAFWYFGRWWDEADSKYGLIFKDKISELTNVYQERLTVGESYSKIIEDLDFAIQHAPGYASGKRVSKQLAQALKAKLLINRGKGNDYTDALALVKDVMDKATGLGLVLEPTLTSLYNNSWDSKELLFCRFRETTDNVISAYNYTYGYNYPTLLATDMTKSFLTGDPRYAESWGQVRSPVTNNNTFYLACKKLCRKGRQDGGDNDKYTSYFLRLTELYLMRAELLVRTGAPVSQAMEFVNDIRNRSGLADTTATTTANFYKILYKELFVELHMENDADWMGALRIMGDDGRQLLYTLRASATNILPDRFVYPIPKSEMRFNYLVVQNPGYEHLTY